MKKGFQLLFLIFLISSLQAIELSSGDDLFKKALTGEGSFNAAASEYAHMILEKSADPAELYYNLGNTLYLDNRNIPALTAYSAALTYKPGNSDYLANRDLVLSEMELPVPVPSGREYIFHAPVMLLGLYGSRMLLIMILLIALVTAVLFTALKSEIYKTGSFVFLILSFILSLSVFTWDFGSTAIVKDVNTTLRQGDSPLYEAVTTLAPGTEIKLMEERAGWYRIKTLRTHDMQSLEGWLRSSEVMQVSELIESLN